MSKKKQNRPEKQRALLLYMAGDNDLSDAGMRDVVELCREGGNDELYIGIEIDTDGLRTGSIRYEITAPEPMPNGKRRAHRKVIERLEERDSGKPETLLAFIKWGLSMFPASETVVVIGGHGSGFRGGNRSIAVDYNGSAIEMDELSLVFHRAKLQNNPIALLGFDACLMGMLEVAHHISPYAKHLICSQEVEPADGWPYDRVLKNLKTKDEIDIVAKNIAGSYIDYYKRNIHLSITQSVIDLAATGAAMEALGALGETLVRALRAAKADGASLQGKIERARSIALSFHDAEYVDVVHLAEELSKVFPNSETAKACDVLRRATKDAIIENKVPTRSKALANANGLSVWFPPTKFSWIVARSKYLKMSGVRLYPCLLYTSPSPRDS